MWETFPQSHTQPITRAGLPTTRAWSSTGCTTTDPDPTVAKEPMSLPQMIVAFAPIDAPRRTTVGVISQSGFTARGYMSLVNTALGPTNTSSSRVTPENTETLFWIFTPLPIDAPLSTKTFLPRLQPEPIVAPSRMWQWCQTRVSSPTEAPGSTIAVSCEKYVSGNAGPPFGEQVCPPGRDGAKVRVRHLWHTGDPDPRLPWCLLVDLVRSRWTGESLAVSSEVRSGGVIGFSLPPTNRQRVEFVTLLVVTTAFTTGPVYVFAVRVLGARSAWEDPWIRSAFIAAAVIGSVVWLSVALDRRLKRLDVGLVLAGLFTALAVLSTLWSILPRQTLWRSLVYCGMLAVAWCLASMRSSVFSAFMLCLAGFGTISSILMWLVRPEVGLDDSGTWRGIYTNPNSLGPICALLMITLFSMAIQNRDLRIRTVAAGGVLIPVVPLVGSRSDTAIAALVMSFAVGGLVMATAVLWRRGRREWSIALGVVGTVVAVLASALLLPRLATTSGIRLRTEVWDVVWDRIWVKPRGGYGFFSYWGTRDSMSPRVMARSGSAHNSALEASLDLGIGGFVLVVSIAVTAIVRSVRDVLVRPCPVTLYWLMLAVFVVASHLTESFVSWFSYMWILLVVLASKRTFEVDAG